MTAAVAVATAAATAFAAPAIAQAAVPSPSARLVPTSAMVPLSALDPRFAGVSRTVVWGDITVTRPGQVLNGLDVHGRVIVQAPNVTIQNSVVRGADSGSQYGLVDNMSGAPGLKIYDTEIAATNPNWTVNGIMGWNFELHRVNIHNTVDQVSVVGGNVVVADSWLHGSLWYANDPDHTDGSHADNIEIIGGDNISIVGNTMTDATNAAIQVTQDRATVSNLLIAGNSIDYGDCSINIAEKGRGGIPGVSIVDNRFGLLTSINHCGIVSSPGTGIALSGNGFDDGAWVDVKRGA